MLDLCCGLGGASSAFRDNGWEVITVDIDHEFEPVIVADIRELSGFELSRIYGQFDFVWASPPCTEFCKRLLPWIKEEIEPDMSIYLAAKRIISEINPPFWAIENVRGAVKYFGPTHQTIEPFYLWGNFPPIGAKGIKHHKDLISAGNQKKRAALRACVPYQISKAMCDVLTWQTRLF
jgi:hypothetical protein